MTERDGAFALGLGHAIDSQCDVDVREIEPAPVRNRCTDHEPAIQRTVGEGQRCCHHQQTIETRLDDFEDRHHGLDRLDKFIPTISMVPWWQIGSETKCDLRFDTTQRVMTRFKSGRALI